MQGERLGDGVRGASQIMAQAQAQEQEGDDTEDAQERTSDRSRAHDGSRGGTAKREKGRRDGGEQLGSGLEWATLFSLLLPVCVVDGAWQKRCACKLCCLGDDLTTFRSAGSRWSHV
ncbi:hypothetical protein CCMA1212_000681 [Trichoderma ghanense]|uniref:Uncharacterized protein n=1 Tax=Trichoderma ghanense TaxID=65468 RepID=A0ABY2HEW5_9HYPO